MTDDLFPNLPEQRPGPVTVDGRTLIKCRRCDGTGFEYEGGNGDDALCLHCNGGGVVLVRT